MRILFLFLLASALFAEEWREPDALYRLTVNHDVVGECGFLDFMRICLPVTLENGVAVYSEGKPVAVHQYNADHLLLPASLEKTVYTVYYGFSKKRPLQRIDSRIAPPSNIRLSQSDLSRKFPKSAQELLTPEEFRKKNPSLRSVRELRRAIGKYSVQRIELLTRLHAKSAPGKISPARFRQAGTALRNQVKNLPDALKKDLENAYFAPFRRRPGRPVSRIFFTRRPFDTDREFSSLFSGLLAVKESGEYEFRLNTNSTRILQVDGKTVHSRIGIFQSPDATAIGSTDTVTVPLSRGLHPFRFLYAKGPVGTWAAVSWRKRGEGEFRLLDENDFAPGFPLIPVRSEGRGGGLCPIVLRDDSLALKTEKWNSAPFIHYTVLSPEKSFHWERNGERFDIGNGYFVMPESTVLRLVPDSPGWLPLQILHKTGAGEKAAVLPNLSLHLWAPHFLYDDESATITAEIRNGHPVDVKAVFEVCSLKPDSVISNGREVISLPAVPLENENRYAQTRILKKDFQVQGRCAKQGLYKEFSLSLPGLETGKCPIRMEPVANLPPELKTSPDGLTDCRGVRLIPLLHRPTLHELRTWEVPRKLLNSRTPIRQVLVIAEPLPDFENRLREEFERCGMKVEFLPWSSSALPSGSALLETLPRIQRQLHSAAADAAVLIPPAKPESVLGAREDLNTLSLILELIAAKDSIRRIVLSTPFPDLTETDVRSEEAERDEALRRLRRERGTGFLELNALLLRGENVPEAFSARAAELIRTEFTGK